MIRDLMAVLKEQFGSSVDAVLGAIISMFIFFAGLAIDRVSNYIKQSQERAETRQLLKMNMMSLLKLLYRQSTEIKKYSASLDMRHPNYSLKIYSLGSNEILIDLGYAKVHSSLLNGFTNKFINHKDRLKAFNQLWSTIYYLKKFHFQILTENDFFLDNYNRFNEIRNNEASTARTKLDEVRDSFVKQKVYEATAEHFNKVENVLLELQAQYDFTNPVVLNDYYVMPLIELNRLVTKEQIPLAENFRSIEINHHLLNANGEYNNMCALVNATQGQANGRADEYLEQYQQLKKSYRNMFPNVKFKTSRFSRIPFVFIFLVRTLIVCRLF